MRNRLYLRDHNNGPWANVEVAIFWKNGKNTISHVNRNGTAFFSGEGVVSHVIVAEERIDINLKVHGGCTIVAVSRISLVNGLTKTIHEQNKI